MNLYLEFVLLKNLRKKEKNIILKKFRIGSWIRIRACKSDPDPDKSRPDPQHWAHVLPPAGLLLTLLLLEFLASHSLDSSAGTLEQSQGWRGSANLTHRQGSLVR